jgi:transposase
MRTGGHVLYLCSLAKSKDEEEPHVRVTTLLNKLLNLPGLWVRGIRFENDALVIVADRSFRLLRCPECGTEVRGRFEQKTRRWRHLAIWGMSTFIEAPIRRLRCPQCRKVQTEAVPWARHRSAFTRTFEEVVGLLAQKLDHTSVAELTDISWVTVGAIAERLVDELLHEDRFDNLLAIGVDEISYRRHHRYLTIVIDHDQERVIWAGEGKSAATLNAFFDELSDEQLDSIQFVSIDMANAYISAVVDNLPDATIVFDRFHVARLAQDRVDEVRRALMRVLDPEDRSHLKRTRWVLLKRPERLDGSESKRLEAIRKHNDKLYRAYMLKETLLDVFELDSPSRARPAIEAWISWAQRSRLKPFVQLARTVRRHIDGILAFIDSRLTNARLEGMNNKIRLLSHRAYGFHSAEPLIAMVYLCCSKISLPEIQLA